MKYIIYKSDVKHHEGPYQLSKIFDDEDFVIFEAQEFTKAGIRATIPRPHISIRRASADGIPFQTNVLNGEFVEAMEGHMDREARILVAHLNDVYRIMDA